MVDNNYEYRASLDDRDILQALRRIDANMEKIAKGGQAAFSGIERNAKLSGLQIGVTAGVAGELTRQFIELGRQAVQVFERIITDSVKVAASLDTAEKSFTGIFQGNEPAAMAAIERLRQASRRLGIDLTEVGRSFVPEVESLDQLERVAKLAASLATAQPEQGAVGARISLQEALSGELLSLKRRFELSPDAIDRIKELQKELGNTEGLVVGLEAEMKRLGRDIETTLGDTLAASFGRVEQQGIRFQAALGVPIVEELKQQLDGLSAVLGERGVDFEEMAGAVGDVVANVVELVGSGLTDFLANLDKEQVLAIVDDFQALVDKAAYFADILNLMELPEALFQDIDELLVALNRAATTAGQIGQLATAEAARQEGQNLKAQELGYFSAITAFYNPFAGEDWEKIEAAGERAFTESIQRTQTLNEQAEAEAEARATERAKRRADREAKRASASDQQADTFLKEQQAAKDAAAALEEYNAALEKVTEAQAKFETELEQRGSDIGLDAERKRFDAMQDFAEKRAIAARKGLQKIEDIERDFGRDLEDNERDRSRAFLDQAKEEAQEKLDIETDFQRQLQDIRSRFAFDLEEAERNRDAITFLRLQRQQQEEVQQAQEGRSQDIDDARAKGEQKRDELRTQQERENEDARIAMDRKLEDQRINQARELEEIRFAEMIKEAEIQTWQDRQFEDLKLWGIRKQEELNLQLAAELELIKAYEEQKTQVVEEQNARRAAATQGRGAPQTSLGSSLPPTPGSRPSAGGTPHGTRRRSRQGGGPVSAGVPYVVGENGPELFNPAQSGYILPNNPAITALAGQSSVVNNVSNSTTYNGNFSMLRPDALTPTQMAIVENIAVNIFRRINGG